MGMVRVCRRRGPPARQACARDGSNFFRRDQGQCCGRNRIVGRWGPGVVVVIGRAAGAAAGGDGRCEVVRAPLGLRPERAVKSERFV
jgi:hypothetical protein